MAAAGAEVLTARRLSQPSACPWRARWSALPGARMPQDRNGGEKCTRRDGCLAGTNPGRDHRIAQEQAALRRVAVLVAGGAPPEEVFSAVAEEMRRLLEVDFATMVRYDPQDASAVAGTWTRTGAPSPTPVGDRMPLGGRNLSTLVYQTESRAAPADRLRRRLGRNQDRRRPRVGRAPLVGGRADPD